MVMISGGSSVGARDFTVEVLDALPDTDILVHGISISPGKPTILARSGHKPFWGLPGHAVSAMVVFAVVVRPFLERLCGLPAANRSIWRSGCPKSQYCLCPRPCGLCPCSSVRSG